MVRRRGSAVTVAVTAALVLVPAAAGEASGGGPDRVTGAQVPDVDLGGLRDRLRTLTWSTPVDLGVRGSSSPDFITESGIVVGQAFPGSPYPSVAAFRWRDGKVDLLTGPQGQTANAYGVNNAGVVVGAYRAGDGEPLQFAEIPFIWYPDGLRQRIGAPDWVAGRAVGIDDAGNVLVHVVGEPRAKLWRRGALSDLPPGFSASVINRHGEIAGRLDVDGGPRAAVLRDGVVQELPSPDDGPTWVSGFDDRGRVLGWSDAGPVLWERDGRMRVLDPQGTGFTPAGVDSRGRVYGGVMVENDVRAAVSDERGLRRMYTLDARTANVWDVGGDVAVGVFSHRDNLHTLHPIVWVGEVPVPLGEKLAPRAGEAPFDPAVVSGVATAVNDAHVVVGQVFPDGTGFGRAVMWRLAPGR